MNNLSLTSTEFERLLKVFGTLTFGLVALISGIQIYLVSADIGTAILKAFSMSLALSTMAFGVFYKAAWRWERVAKWMQRPIVHGVWAGQLRSDYGGHSEEQLKLPIIFVVRQTYLTLSVQSFTTSQEGESRLEALIHNSKTEATRLSYVFELRKIYSGAKIMTSGAGELKLVGRGMKLKGDYWTNTPTHGELLLALVSRECDGVTCYADALQKWPTQMCKALTQAENP
jgi:hypothetical protein